MDKQQKSIPYQAKLLSDEHNEAARLRCLNYYSFQIQLTARQLQHALGQNDLLQDTYVNSIPLKSME